MVAGYYQHRLKQGENYSIDIDIRDSNGLINTTGWTGASAIKTLDKAAPIGLDNLPIAFAVAFPALGKVRFTLTPTQTDALPPKRYLYDALLVDASGTPGYYLDGDVIVQRSHTSGSINSVAPLVTVSGSLPALLPTVSGVLSLAPVVTISGTLPTLLPTVSGSLNSVASSGSAYDFSQPQNAFLIGV